MNTETSHDDGAPLVSLAARFRLYVKLPFLRLCAKMRFWDVYARYLFPCAFLPYVLAAHASIDFGNDWHRRIAQSSC